MANDLSARLSGQDLWAMVRRRRWAWLTPLAAGAVLGGLTAVVWPARYRSQALVLVDQQQVPRQLVASNVAVTAAYQLQTLTQRILSRTKLRQLITQLDLYPRQRPRLTPDQVVARMRKDIQISPVTALGQPNRLTAFRIAYKAPSPQVAQRVVNELTTLFIDGSLQAQADQSQGTTSFLQDQLLQASAALAQKQQQLKLFDQHYLDELPVQGPEQIQRLASLRTAYSATDSGLDAARQEQAYLQSLQLGLARMGTDPQSPQAHLQKLEARLAQLEAGHTARYPDVITTKAEIRHWKAELQSQPIHGASWQGSPGAVRLASRLRAVRMQIATRRRTLAALAAQMRRVESDLRVEPLRAGQLARLQQSTQDARRYYRSLLGKTQNSELATNLEESQQGERLELLDPANLPRHPVAPNRVLCVIGGWLLGLVAGAGLVVLLDLNDHRLRGEAGFVSVSGLPLLAAVPQLASPGRQRRAAWRACGEWAVASVLLITAVASTVLTLKGTL
ncbi:MAG: GNVR domain-containing protein [Terriglobales bacterium]